MPVAKRKPCSNEMVWGTFEAKLAKNWDVKMWPGGSRKKLVT